MLILNSLYFTFYLYLTATEFSKTTGDYASLSLVDIKLIALAIQFQEELEPVHFKDASVRTVFGSGEPASAGKPESTLPMGFHMPKLELGKYEAHFATHSYVEGFNLSAKDTELLRKLDGVPLGDLVHIKRWMDHVKALLQTQSPAPEKQNTDSGCEESEEDVEEDEDTDEEEAEDSDEGGWITPSNYKPKPQVLQSAVPSVAVLSTDFAIQVLTSGIYVQYTVSPLTTTGWCFNLNFTVFFSERNSPHEHPVAVGAWRANPDTPLIYSALLRLLRNHTAFREEVLSALREFHSAKSVCVGGRGRGDEAPFLTEVPAHGAREEVLVTDPTGWEACREPHPNAGPTGAAGETEQEGHRKGKWSL